MSTARSTAAKSRRSKGKTIAAAVQMAKGQYSPPPTDKSRRKPAAAISSVAVNDRRNVELDSDQCASSDISAATSTATSGANGTGAAEMQQIMLALDARMKRKQSAVQKRLQVEFNKVNKFVTNIFLMNDLFIMKYSV